MIKTPLPAIQLGAQTEYNISVYLKKMLFIICGQIIHFVVRISRKREELTCNRIQDFSREKTANLHFAHLRI